MISSNFSLVRYDNPVLVNDSKKRGSAKGARGSTLKKQKVPVANGGGNKTLPPVENKPQLTQTEDILNSILPPRQWDDSGQLWVQYVSSTPATRLDVINLQEQLDQLLIQRKAKETGICPVREELYEQCFGMFNSCLY
jgi:dynein light intermediate chain